MDWMSIRGEKDSMSEGKEKWYTMAEAMKETGVSRVTLTRAINEGRMVASQITDSSGAGFHFMVSETNLLEWLENRKSKKTEVLKKNKAPQEMTVDSVSEWITAEIQKAYETGFKDGLKTAKTKMMEAAKEIR